MSPLSALALLGLGLALIVKGGDLFVEAAVWIAGVSGMPRFLVGATVVSLATTLPELAVSLLASAAGAAGIAAGNAVGSVSANLGLILGLSLALAPALPGRDGQGFKLGLMAGAAGLLYALCAGGRLGAVGAAAMLCLCAAFLADAARTGRQSARQGAQAARPSPAALLAGGGKFLAGAAGILLGARLLCDNGAALARLLGVPEGVIGATLVAAGTSLPELVTALAALRRGQAELSLGNVVGANIIDLTLILPLCALAGGGRVLLPRQSLMLDMPFCLALALLAALPPLASGRFCRWQGPALLVLYAVYLAMLLA